MPELLRILLPYLDLKSTSNLAHSKVMSINILQGTCDWGKPFLTLGAISHLGSGAAGHSPGEIFIPPYQETRLPNGVNWSGEIILFIGGQK